MPRLYRLKWADVHGETVTLSDGVPADVADQIMEGLTKVDHHFNWRRIWIETLDGQLVDFVERKPSSVSS